MLVFDMGGGGSSSWLSVRYARLKAFAQVTPQRWAFSDFVNVVDGTRVGFEGRAQMGGFGATMLLHERPQGIWHRI